MTRRRFPGRWLPFQGGYLWADSTPAAAAILGVAAGAVLQDVAADNVPVRTEVPQQLEAPAPDPACTLTIDLCTGQVTLGAEPEDGGRP